MLLPHTERGFYITYFRRSVQCGITQVPSMRSTLEQSGGNLQKYQIRTKESVKYKIFHALLLLLAKDCRRWTLDEQLLRLYNFSLSTPRTGVKTQAYLFIKKTVILYRTN